MIDESFVKALIPLLGGSENITSAMNCMTRLRFNLADDGAVREADLHQLPEVLGVNRSANYIEVVVGPGKARKCMDLIRALGLVCGPDEKPGGSAAAEQTSAAGENPAPAAEKAKPDRALKSAVQKLCKDFGRIFAPMIPGICAAGVCAGLASMISQLVPGYADLPVLLVIYQLLNGVSAAMITYLTAWTGYRAAEFFGGTPILGGILGMFAVLGNVDVISRAVGLYNAAQPLDSILRVGRGGVLAVVIGVWVLCRVEKWLRKRIPEALDTVFTPLLALLITLIPYLLLVMPVTGLISQGLAKLVSLVAFSPNAIVRLIAGAIGAALFLPLVALGMHHGLIAIYSVQLETLGYVLLYPALAMAGAGQVGAAIALAVKAKKAGNRNLVKTINSALPAGILGVGEPLIYSVMLPLGRPMLTASLGGAFGGAFVMLMEVAATTWGPSGILGVFVMTEGPRGALVSVGCYLIGLVISAVMGWLITMWMVRADALSESKTGA